jgi:Dockerin type I domain
MLQRIRRNRKSASRKPAPRKSARLRSRRLNGFESLEDRIALSATPFGAQPGDTAEFLLGTVDVSVVLLESNDVLSNDNPTVGSPQEENWTTQSIAAVKQNITEGLQWWVDTLAGITDKQQLSFNIDFNRADTPVSTRFEPITQPSTDYQFWGTEFIDGELTETTGSLLTDIKTFNNQQREADGTDWAFTIFVVNDENDADGRFAPGGLDRAFSFPGGLFVVTPASRPASTIAHEVGHIFWALDEYQISSIPNQHLKTRGYYNSPNTNAADNPALNSQTREPSIMDRGSCDEGGGLLCDAFEQNSSSQSSLEMVGWRDSDGDGIFDVLDVEHTLEGTGSYNPATGTYRFVGESSVQTLPNLNPRLSSLPTESLQSDITINKISRAEYRIDGGAWQTAATPDTYVASLDLTFAVPSSANLIEIRTIDAVTGVTSPVFSADLTSPASTANAGVSGFVFDDTNSNGQLETGEAGLAGRNVQLVDPTGQPLPLQQGIEPDDFPANAVIGPNSSATLTAMGTATSGSLVYARSVGTTSTGSQAFSACSFTSGGGACSIFQSDWTSRTRELRVDFDSPVNSVSIDAISNNAADFGRLTVYDANDNLLARYTTGSLASGVSETMTLSRPTADIAYAVAGGHADTGVGLDNLVFGAESNTTTDQFGAFSLPNLPDGNYSVQVAPAAGSQATSPTTQSVTISSAVPAAIADFGFASFVSSWQNPSNRFDVNNDGFVSPIDALLVINDLNLRESRTLDQTDIAPPYIDVDGDGNVAPIDVLQVINAIDQASGESESNAQVLSASVVVATGSPIPEGEFVPLDQTIVDSLQTQDRRSLRDSTLATTPLARLPFQSAKATDAVGRSAHTVRAVSSSLSDDLLTSIRFDNLIDDLASDVAAAYSK